MEFIESYYHRILSKYIESAQMNDWVQLEHLLRWLNDNFLLLALLVALPLAVLVSRILSKLGLSKYLLKLQGLLFTKLAPRTITIVERKPYQSYSAHYLTLQNQFIQAGFKKAKHYHNQNNPDHNLATFYKDGVCGVINSQAGKDWFELVAYFKDSTSLTVSSDVTSTLFDRPPDQGYFFIDKECSVAEAYKLLQSKRQGRRVYELSDSNFKATYEDAYQQYIGFLKERY